MNINDVDGSTLNLSELTGRVTLALYPEGDEFPAVLSTCRDVYYYENQSQAMEDEQRIHNYKKELV